MVSEPVLAVKSTLESIAGNLGDFYTQQKEKLPEKDHLWGTSVWQWLGGNVEQENSQQMTESYCDKIVNHVKSHIIAYSGILAFSVGLSGYLAYQGIRPTGPYNGKSRRRRVPKLSNGARRDVVLIVGLPTEPMTRLIAIDFEKRGFIVYMTILDEKDSRYIESNSITEDLNFLNLYGAENGEFLHEQITKFNKLFHTGVTPFEGAKPHLLRLVGVVFAPTLYFPLSPMENLQQNSWNRVLARLSTTTSLLSSGLLELVRNQQSKIVAMIPAIVSALRLPYHGPEVVMQNSLKDIFSVLAKELKPQGIQVTQIRLGNLNITPVSRNMTPAVDAEIRSWSSEMQSMYGSHFHQSQSCSKPIGNSLSSKGIRGLHHILFDVIYGKKGEVVYYGLGAFVYGVLGAVAS